MTYGETIRKHRERRKLLLRQLAAFLEVDTVFVSKLERSERNASCKQVMNLAQFLQTPLKPFLNIWLVDKISDMINNGKEGEHALKLVLKIYKIK